MLRCALPGSATELRVFADASFDSLIVTVQSPGAKQDVESHSVLIRGGSFTPPYRFDRASADWRRGGAYQFERSSDAESGTAGAVRQSPSERLESPAGFEDVSLGTQAWRYLVLGFHHILPAGWDHVLFVASLVLGSGLMLRRLLWQLSAFTVAHTVTLALGTLGWIALPAALVEPLIAFSITVVAVENLVRKSQTRARTAVVFGFGLLHGLGFAGALSETGLAQGEFLLSLLAFNCGVEFGQLVVVVCVLGILIPFKNRAELSRFVLRPASLVIAATGFVWGVQRLLS
jgi:hypothetical protein